MLLSQHLSEYLKINALERQHIELQAALQFAEDKALQQLKQETTGAYAVFIDNETSLLTIRHNGINSFMGGFTNNIDTQIYLTEELEVCPIKVKSVNDPKRCWYAAWSFDEQNNRIGSNLTITSTGECYSFEDRPENDQISSEPNNTFSLGLPVDNETGMLKQRLSELDAKTETVGRLCNETIWEIRSGKELNGIPMIKRIPNNAEQAHPLQNGSSGIYPYYSPVPVDLELSAGLFYTKYDKYHRIRFHQKVTWWNPYALPIDMGNDSRGYIVLWGGLPEMQVTNNNTYATFVFDLNDFNAHSTYNQPSESQIHAWMDFSGGYIGAGECLTMLEPQDQSEGLARTLTNNKWTYSPYGFRPIGVWDNKWIAKAHSITITPTSTPAAYIRVYPFDTPIPENALPENYGNPVLEIRNIPFVYTSWNGTASSYIRETSTSYAYSNRKLVWRLKLKDTPEAIDFLLKTIDPRGPVIDLAVPETRSCFKWSCDWISDGLTPMESDLFRTEELNKHGTNSPLMLFDCITKKPESIGSLRSLIQTDYLPMSLGEKNGNNMLFDRYRTSKSSKSPPLSEAFLNINTMSETTWRDLLKNRYSKFPFASLYDEALPFIELSAEDAAILAHDIYSEIEQKKPFLTLRDFLSSGIIEAALLKAGISEKTKTDGMTLHASDIVTRIAPMLSTHSDTLELTVFAALERRGKPLCSGRRRLLLQRCFSAEGAIEWKCLRFEDLPSL
ncbi:MAG: hypothetical protein JW739_07630 [Opitutales bacterium]|nr:hypothetical protein [Opitutales bacterium]